MQAAELFVFPESLPFRDFFLSEATPWTWVSRIAEALEAFVFPDERTLPEIPPGLHLSGPVYFGQGVRLPPYGSIIGPAWIGDDCTLLPGVYIRGRVIAGRGSVLGHCCEYKNALLLERVETPHFNYVGDSVLGNGAHLGAGAVCANLKLARDEVIVRTPDGGRAPSGLTKLGALIGDGAEAGCNCVLQPGTILGRRSAVVAPAFHGFLPADTLALSDIRPQFLPRDAGTQGS